MAQIAVLCWIYILTCETFLIKHCQLALTSLVAKSGMMRIVVWCYLMVVVAGFRAVGRSTSCATHTTVLRLKKAGANEQQQKPPVSRPRI